ncbi:MAG TPA: endonuclease/exonuclease/phosphatase family protein [Cryptosporangiaceae bacterium]|nr:endonuclease/exonuclease/phosphatase family protein [Cryptosporangiaceae bacterium]
MADESLQHRLRVLTFNLLAMHQADGGRRQIIVERGLRELRPDVVAFQEVLRTAAHDQVRDLLGPDYHVVDHPRASPDGIGACLATRFPVGATQEIELRVTSAAADLPWSAAVVAEVHAPAPVGPLLVVHHKPSWQYGREYEREQQALATARSVERLVAGRDLPVVLLGDFDAAPDAASVRFWTGRQSLAGTSVCYQDAWEAVHPEVPGHTFSPRNRLVRDGEMPLERGRRIDYVMVRCGPHGPPLEVTRCDLVFADEVDGVWASDHFGVFAELQVPVTRPGGP